MTKDAKLKLKKACVDYLMVSMPDVSKKPIPDYVGVVIITIIFLIAILIRGI